MEKLTWHTETRKVADLIPWEKNPRKLTPVQAKHLDESLEKFDLVEIPVINTDNRLIAGHQRCYRMMLKGRGEETVDVRVPNRPLSEEEFTEYNVRSNKNTGEWDWAKLAEFERQMLLEVGFDMKDVQKILSASEQRVEARAKLTERFIIPPFSVFDTRAGYWQDRKRAWLALTGNLAETKDEVLWKSGGGGSGRYYVDKTKVEAFLGHTLTPQEFEEQYVPDLINDGSSIFDPVLAEIIYTWFIPDRGGRILDPFGGEQTKGVDAGELGYGYTAVEFRHDQVDTNEKATAEYKDVKYICGDSNNIDTLVADDWYDLVFTSPPYYDLEVYSKEDMSALGTYEEFMAQYKNIFTKAVEKLADNRFVVVTIGEVRDKKTGKYRDFVKDNIQIFEDLGLTYWNEIILLNPTGTLPIRAPRSFNQSRKIGKAHQNVLAFYKGDAEKLWNESRAIYTTHQNILTFFKGDPKQLETYGPVHTENEVLDMIEEDDSE